MFLVADVKVQTRKWRAIFYHLFQIPKLLESKGSNAVLRLELEIADRNEATALATLPPLIQKSDDGHPECLINVSLDILDIFQANRKSDVILCHAGLGLFFVRELLVGG